MEELMKRTGRPSKYTPVLGEKICRLLAEGTSLRQICVPDDMPDRRTVIKWVLGQVQADGIELFRDQYMQAREVQYELLFDEVLDIADDSSNDFVDRIGRGGREFKALDPEALQRSKLRIETRLTVLERMRPKKYGKLTQTDITSAGLSLTPPTPEAKSTARDAILRELNSDPTAQPNEGSTDHGGN
jgi:hypothetical protein